MTADVAAGLRLHGDVLARSADLDLAVNVPAGGPPGWLRDVLTAALDDVAAYPDEDRAVRAVAGRHGRPADEVVLLNGAAQAFWLVAHATGARRTVCVHPSFTEPEVALRTAGRPVERVVLEAPYRFDPAAIPDEADLVVLGNPTNPTGVLHPREHLARLCRPGRTVVVDEAFMDFVPGERESLAAARDLPGLVVVRSLTKIHALPGLRVGYLLAPAPIARLLADHRPGWSVNALAIAAAEACSARPDHAASVAAATTRARADLVARLQSHPQLAVSAGAAANFVLVHGPGDLADGLARRGIAVRPCASFPGLTPAHVRVTVRDAPAHARLAAAIAACT